MDYSCYRYHRHVYYVLHIGLNLNRGKHMVEATYRTLVGGLSPNPPHLQRAFELTTGALECCIARTEPASRLSQGLHLARYLDGHESLVGGSAPKKTPAASFRNPRRPGGFTPPGTRSPAPRSSGPVDESSPETQGSGKEPIQCVWDQQATLARATQHSTERTHSIRVTSCRDRQRRACG